MKKKILISILSLALVVSLMPLSVFANAKNESETKWNIKTIAENYGWTSGEKLDSEAKAIGNDAYLHGGTIDEGRVFDTYTTYDGPGQIQFLGDTPASHDAHCFNIDLGDKVLKQIKVTARGGATLTGTPKMFLTNGEATSFVNVEVTDDFVEYTFDDAPGLTGEMCIGFDVDDDPENETWIEVSEISVLTENQPAETCTVTFMNGDEVYDTQEVEFGDLATKPADPTKEGYKFNGWFVSPAAAGSAFDFENTPIFEDTTLYADWVQNDTPTPTPTPTPTGGGSGTSGQAGLATGDNTITPIIFIGIGLIAGITGFIAYRRLRNK